MPFRIETGAQGEDILVEERVRSRAARAWDWIALAVTLGSGLFCLSLFARLVVLPALAGRPTDGLTVLLLALVMGAPGAAMTVLALLSVRHASPRVAVERHVVDDAMIEALAELPADPEILRLPAIRRRLAAYDAV